MYIRMNKNDTILQGISKYYYVIAAMLGAFLGSHLLALAATPSLFASGITFKIFMGNKTIIGAIAGGVIGIEIVKKILKIERRTGDGVVIPLILAIIIGRIGCEFAGVSDGTIGTICHLPWCFTQGDSFPRHPLPLYEIMYLLLLLPSMIFAYKRKLFSEGTLFRIFTVLYFGLRFLLEFLKDDPRPFYSLTVIQIFCLVWCVYYVYSMIGQTFLRNNNSLQELR